MQACESEHRRVRKRFRVGKYSASTLLSKRPASPSVFTPRSGVEQRYGPSLRSSPHSRGGAVIRALLNGAIPAGPGTPRDIRASMMVLMEVSERPRGGFHAETVIIALYVRELVTDGFKDCCNEYQWMV